MSNVLGALSEPDQPPLVSILWLGGADEGGGEAGDDLGGALIAQLAHPGGSGRTQVVQGVAAGGLQRDIREADGGELGAVLVVGEGASDAAGPGGEVAAQLSAVYQARRQAAMNDDIGD